MPGFATGIFLQFQTLPLGLTPSIVLNARLCHRYLSSIPDPSFRVDTIHRTQCPALPPVSFFNSNAVPRLLSSGLFGLAMVVRYPIVDLLKPLFPGISCDSGPAILLDSTLSRLPKWPWPEQQGYQRARLAAISYCRTWFRGS
jgi:hypothetical protein